MTPNTDSALARPLQKAVVSSLPETGFLRLHQIIGKRPDDADPQGIPAIVPVSRATWYAWIKSGHAPAPVRLGPNVAAWRVEDIRALIQRIGGAG